MRKYIYFIITAVFLVVMLFECKKQVKNPKVHKDDKNVQDKGNCLVREYEKEGFVTNNKFCVIIVVPEGDDQLIGDALRDAARKRALTTLKSYLVSKNIMVNSNTNARLINLISSDGKLSMIKSQKKTRKVYLFEIEKHDLRRYIHKIAKKRR